MYKIKYRKPQEMKDSGIEWIGKIPKNWILSKIKNYYRYEKGKRAQKLTKEYVALNRGEFPVYSGQTENQGIMGFIDSYDYDIERCLFTTTVGAKVMTPMILSGKFSLSQNCLIMLKTKEICDMFVYYWFHPLFKYEKSLIPSYMQPSLRIEDLNKYYIYAPIISEQQKIANFLDIKTAEFNSIISKKEKLIEKLEEAKKSLISEVVTGKVKIVDGQLVKRKPEEMKESGVEWLGMIPKDWDLKKIKHLSRTISKGTTPTTVGRELLEMGEVKFLKAENIVNNKIAKFPENFIDKETNQILKRSELKEKDILFVIAGATIGKVAIVDESVVPANTNQAISFIRLKDEKDCEYVYYWMISYKLQNHMWSFAVQAAQPNLSMENLGNFFIPYPSIDERDIIVDILDKINKKIEKIITKIQFQIQKLKEAKQSLISEAVTGKIDLRDWEIIEGEKR
jgi:type I restriction enzyme S subunit